MWVGIEDALAGARNAGDAIDRLVRSYVGIALDSSDLVLVLAHGGGELPADTAARHRRDTRTFLDTWGHVLRAVRPELSGPEGQLLARATMSGIIAAVQQPSLSRVNAEELVLPLAYLGV